MVDPDALRRALEVMRMRATDLVNRARRNRCMAEHGAAATEFVLVLPTVLVAVFGIILAGIAAFNSLLAATTVPLDARDWAVTGALGNRTQTYLGVVPSVQIDPDCDRAAHVSLASSQSWNMGALLGVWTTGLRSGTTVYRMVFDPTNPTSACQ